MFLGIAKSTASDLPEPEKTTQPITTVTQKIIEPIEESSQNATEVVEEAVAEPQNVTINVTTEEVAPPKPQKPKPLMCKYNQNVKKTGVRARKTDLCV